jgi:hypothetical protein
MHWLLTTEQGSLKLEIVLLNQRMPYALMFQKTRI